MMRRIASLVLASSVSLSLFACGSDSGSPNAPWDGVTPTGSDTAAGDTATTPGTGASPTANATGSPGASTSSDPNTPPGATTDPNTPVTPGTGAPTNSDTPTTTPTSSAPAVEVKPPTVGACSEPELGAPLLRLLTRFEFQNTIDDVFPGISGQWTNSLPSNSVSAAGFDNSASAVLGAQATEGLERTAESVGDAVSGQLSSLLPCAAAADQACAAQFLDTYGKRMYRRALSTTERDRYLSLFDTALAQTDFATAIKWLTAGLVQSPNSVYRSEIGTVQADGTRALTASELATQLAYTFTGTAPSDELLAQAEAGTLTDLAGTAKALLQTENGRNVLHRFFEAYTNYISASTKEKPDAVTNGVAFNQVSGDMVKETRAFIDNIVFNQQGTFQDLLTSSETNPSQQLANYYGIPAPGSDYASVQRPADRGVGLLAQGSFLASHANADASSPTQRGVFTYTRVLCRQKPTVPANVPQLGSAAPGVQTTRQRYEEVHAVDPGCAGCHALFDPIGYAFEHFDEAGRYRADENGLVIDPTGYLTSSAGERLDFASEEDLASALSSLPEVQECFAAYLSTYAFGTSEACLGTSQVPAMQAGALSIVDAFASLATEPHFTARLSQ